MWWKHWRHMSRKLWLNLQQWKCCCWIHIQCVNSCFSKLCALMVKRRLQLSRWLPHNRPFCLTKSISQTVLTIRNATECHIWNVSAFFRAVKIVLTLSKWNSRSPNMESTTSVSRWIIRCPSTYVIIVLRCCRFQQYLEQIRHRTPRRGRWVWSSARSAGGCCGSHIGFIFHWSLDVGVLCRLCAPAPLSILSQSHSLKLQALIRNNSQYMECRCAWTFSAGHNRCPAESKEETSDSIRKDEWHGQETCRRSSGAHSSINPSPEQCREHLFRSIVYTLNLLCSTFDWLKFLPSCLYWTEGMTQWPHYFHNGRIKPWFTS